MKKRFRPFIVLEFILSISTLCAYSQVTINTDGSLPDNSTMLDVKSTEKGLLVPRMTQTQRNAIASPANSLMIFQTDNVPGYYYNSGSSGSPVWLLVGTGAGWGLTGNSGTSPGTNFIGTEDNVPLVFKVNDQYAGKIDHILFNTSLGYQSLGLNTTGSNNTASGYQALYSSTTGNSNLALGTRSLYSNTTRSNLVAIGDSALYFNGIGASLSYQSAGNTAVGSKALFSNTSGYNNTATGYQSLFSNTTGNYNTATGWSALFSNTSGYYNTADGFKALYSNTTGYLNSAKGYQALYSNTTGNQNTANGVYALRFNTVGNDNTANGVDALFSNISGGNNTASGNHSLADNTSGSENAAIGVYALSSNTIGSSNIAVGNYALYSNTGAGQNTAIGVRALYSQSYGSGAAWNSNNVAIGYEALYSNQPSSSLVGKLNTSVGNYALRSNTTGHSNTANGYDALYSNTTGHSNMASGREALYSNTTGNYNTATGTSALSSNTTGNFNTAIGEGACSSTDSDDNTCVGYQAGILNSFTQGTFLGSTAYPTAGGYTNCMALGYNARVNASNKVVIGNTAVTSIGGYAGWTDFSDQRYKRNVQENVKGLEFIMKLRPVTYLLDINKLVANLDEDQRRDSDGKIIVGSPSAVDIESRKEKSRIVHSGFLAQEVEAAARSIGFEFSGVDAPKNENDFYGLRYAEFVVPLVKAVQELAKQNEQLLKRIEELEKK